MKSDLRCKVCQLTKWNQELFVQFHKKRGQGYSIKQLHNWINKEIQIWNADHALPDQKQFISDSALQNHLQKHTNTELTTQALVASKLELVKPAEQILPTNLEKEVVAAALDAEVSDFQKFHALVEKVQLRVDQIDHQLSQLAGTTPSGKDVSNDDVTALVSYLSAFRALADLLGRLRKDAILVRQQDTLLRKVVESVMTTYSTTAITELLKSVDGLILDYKAEFKNPVQVDSFSMKFRSELARVMTDSAKMALEAVKNEFKVA